MNAQAVSTLYRLLLNHAFLLQRPRYLFGRKQKTSAFSLGCTKASPTSKWHKFKSSSHSIAFNKRIQELEMVGTYIFLQSIFPRYLNPHETSLDFAFTTQPSSSTFQRNNLLPSITLLLVCYIPARGCGPASGPPNSHVLAFHQIYKKELQRICPFDIRGCRQMVGVRSQEIQRARWYAVVAIDPFLSG